MSRWTTTFASILVPCMLMGSGQAIAEEAEPAANLNAQAIKRGKTVYNMFIEPQFSVADDGPGQPEWQVFLGFHMQFL